MAKRAVLCGVNVYQIPGADLRGCVNDVQNMKGVLVDLFGFSEDDIEVLTDAGATKAAIQDALETLVGGASAGDVLYFHFSGHGSNVPDQDGDEADERDEIFCPTDLDWEDPLRDDWMREILDRLPDAVNLTFVSDCCHSGTITRAIGPPDERVKERYLPDPRDLRAAESRRALTGVTRSARRELVVAANGGDDIEEVDLNEILITGCRADQTSADAFIDGDFHGALTHSLAAALRDADGDITYRDLHAAVVELLHQGGYSQVPQLEGRGDRFDLPFLSPLPVAGGGGE
jgi:hypothetical protein